MLKGSYKDIVKTTSEPDAEINKHLRWASVKGFKWALAKLGGTADIPSYFLGWFFLFNLHNFFGCFHLKITILNVFLREN